MSSLIVEVCKIDNIIKHPNADRLEVAIIKGWNCIVGKDDHKPGDLVIFIPPDSLIPDNLIEKYKLEYLKKGNRVRTTRLRGFISEGLILPNEQNWPEGKDVATELGITKWEPKVRQSTRSGVQTLKKRHRNPHFDKYTDIENIKNFNTVFNPGDKVVVLEKIHGANWRCGNLKKAIRSNFFLKIWDKLMIKFFGEYEKVYGSHNVQLRWGAYRGHKEGWYKENIYEKVAKKYNFLSFIPEDYIVYGEVFGPQVQKGFAYGLPDGVVDLRIFDVKYKGDYLSYPDFVAFCEKYQLPRVPELFVGEFNEDILKNCVVGNSVLSPDTIREGCVIKSYEETKDFRLGRKILKCISPEYTLLKNKTEHKDILDEEVVIEE